MSKISDINFFKKIVQIIVFAVILVDSNAHFCLEKPLEENIKNSDVILTGLVRRLERNYSEQGYSAYIQIHRILKGKSKNFNYTESFIFNFCCRINSKLRFKVKLNVYCRLFFKSF